MSRESTDPIALAPPLTALTAFAALGAMVVKGVVLPLGDWKAGDFWLEYRPGDFLANLAALAGIVALSGGLLTLMRTAHISLRRRLLLASFSGILLPSVFVATLMERERTTTQIVLFALGACHVLTVLVGSNAARLSSNRLGRSVAITFCSVGLLTLLAEVLRLLNQVQLTVWQVQALEWLRGAGELAYLTALVLTAWWVWPVTSAPRDLAARVVGSAVLLTVAGTFVIAQRALEGDYTLVLYHSQRVSLFDHTAPLFYALPMGLALSGSVMGAVGGDPIRGQAALGAALLLSAGYAPNAPWRLLAMTLATVVVSRAIMALAAREQAASAQ